MNRKWYQHPQALMSAFALLALLDGGLAFRWMMSRQNAIRSETELNECKRLEQQIALVRQEPIRVEDNIRSTESFNQLCESAAVSAGIESDQIIEIAPRSPRRLDRYSYLEQVTLVELRQLTLNQLFRFVNSIWQKDNGLHIRSLSLREPPETVVSDHIEKWNVQMALTTYIYAPILPSEPGKT